MHEATDLEVAIIMWIILESMKELKGVRRNEMVYYRKKRGAYKRLWILFVLAVTWTLFHQMSYPLLLGFKPLLVYLIFP